MRAERPTLRSPRRLEPTGGFAVREVSALPAARDRAFVFAHRVASCARVPLRAGGRAPQAASAPARGRAPDPPESPAAAAGIAVA